MTPERKKELEALIFKFVQSELEEIRRIREEDGLERTHEDFFKPAYSDLIMSGVHFAADLYYAEGIREGVDLVKEALDQWGWPEDAWYVRKHIEDHFKKELEKT